MSGSAMVLIFMGLMAVPFLAEFSSAKNPRPYDWEVDGL